MVKLPSIRDYWNRFPDIFSGLQIPMYMSRDRFRQLISFLHCADNDVERPARGHPGHDPVWKISELMDLFRSCCKKNFLPPQRLSVDEAMIRFKGRHFFKQYIKNKPAKWGLKMWRAAIAESGYVVDIYLYTGKDEKDYAADVGLGGSVVLKLMTDYGGVGHIVAMDNLFSGVSLFEQLLARKIYAVGTARPDWKQFPFSIAYTKDSDQNKFEKGTMFATVKDKKVVAIAWKDSKFVHHLSTAFPAFEPGTTVDRWSSVEKRRVAVPGTPVNKEYSATMGGLDRADQYRGTYYAGFKSTKHWWHSLFFWLKNTAVTNAFIYFNELGDYQKVNQKDFRKLLIEQLIGEWEKFQKQNSRGQKRTRDQNSIPATNSTAALSRNRRTHVHERVLPKDGHPKKRRCVRCKLECVPFNRQYIGVKGCKMCRPVVVCCKRHFESLYESNE